MADINEMTLEEVLDKVIGDLDAIHRSQVRSKRENADITAALHHAIECKERIESYIMGIAL